MKAFRTTVEVTGKEKESFLSDNKLEAIIIGVRALVRILKNSDRLDKEDMEYFPAIFHDLWKNGQCLFAIGKITLEEIDG